MATFEQSQLDTDNIIEHVSERLEDGAQSFSRKEVATLMEWAQWASQNYDRLRQRIDDARDKAGEAQSAAEDAYAYAQSAEEAAGDAYRYLDIALDESASYLIAD